MKLRSLFASILASVALIGCVQEEFPALSNIEVTPSYFTLGVDGGTKEVKVTSAAAWEITDTLPSWLSVSTLKGNGSKDGEAVTVTVAASTDTLARTAYLKFTSGKETQLVTVNQDAFMPDFPEFKGGEYWIMTADRKSVVFPIDDGGNGYGYMNVVATIEGNSTAENIYTFTPVEGEAGGFTIVDTKGRYHIGSTYNSFTVSATNPADGSEVWYVKQVSATGHQIVNKKNTWAIVMSTYGNFCPYPEGHDKSTGELPFLVKVEEVAEEAPLGESMKINEALEYKPELIVEGLVTASSTKGAILTDKSGSILVYGLSSDVTVGDSIKVAGKLDIYNKGYQLKEPQRYELVDSVKHEVKYPKAAELTKTTLPEMVKKDFLAQYVSVKGIVTTDTYNNALIKIGDYTVKTYYSADSYADLNGKAFEITGYMISYKESAKEANLIVTNVSEELKDFVPEPEEPEQTPDEGEPEPTYPTIAEVIAAEDGDAVQTSGLVVATYTRGALIKDDTNYILVYYKPGLEVKVGDVIAVSGVKVTYGGMAQIAADEDNEVPVEAEVLSSDNEVVHPAPTVLAGETFDAQLESKTVSYIEYTGTLSVSGYYYNVNVEGASTAIGSLAYLNAEAFPAATNNTKVKVKGYYIGVSSGKYVNTMTVSVEAVN